jgi:hypothetical protein
MRVLNLPTEQERERVDQSGLALGIGTDGRWLDVRRVLAQAFRDVDGPQTPQGMKWLNRAM